ncbi:MAG TPA: UDP-N-acetylglucosamine 1-carboxyvinyltransferase [Planctomycetaceae bacterium]|nr:UDP-N-acetylglucosamine 1-carboxyvinyltransferase [Planctomycetaceae bacterium]
MAAILRITGRRRVEGDVRAAGSKNAALPMMAAAILADEPVLLAGVPHLLDVDTMGRILRELGVEVLWDEDDTVQLRTVDARPVRAPYRLLRRMRAGFCVLGPLLARRGEAVVALPGGCAIGPRPVDLHLAGLKALGAEIELRHGYVVARARQLRGATIRMAGPDGPTVTGTANVLSAAVLAEGVTVVEEAAIEPEIVALGEMLGAMGAKIDGLGTSTLRIEGVARLGGVIRRIIPDRIEAATLLLAGAITGGTVRVAGVVPEHLSAVCELLGRAGCQVMADGNAVTVHAADRLRGVDVTAEPYPGVPTDLQAQWMALLAVAEGQSTVRDTVFPTRWMHVPELIRLGARIDQFDDRAVVHGAARLSGATVTASDLRASAALVLAGLAAEGTTTVRAVHHLDRGYERLDLKLASLGAEVRRM